MREAYKMTPILPHLHIFVAILQPHTHMWRLISHTNRGLQNDPNFAPSAHICGYSATSHTYVAFDISHKYDVRPLLAI
nr:MAG TPA: hypothetical protein [Caudoviricetes sp.]